jgi:hypothetical protein
MSPRPTFLHGPARSLGNRQRCSNLFVWMVCHAQLLSLSYQSALPPGTDVGPLGRISAAGSAVSLGSQDQFAYPVHATSQQRFVGRNRNRLVTRPPPTLAAKHAESVRRRPSIRCLRCSNPSSQKRPAVRRRKYCGHGASTCTSTSWLRAAVIGNPAPTWRQIAPIIAAPSTPNCKQTLLRLRIPCSAMLPASAGTDAKR